MLSFLNLHLIRGIYKPKIQIINTANKCDGTSASAMALEWSAEWPPIIPKDHADALFTD